MPSLDDLIKYGENYGCDVRSVLRYCAQKREQHRNAWDGYTKDRSGRFEGGIPKFCIDLHPETKKMFDLDMDKQERNKGTERFLKKYPQFLLVDKY